MESTKYVRCSQCNEYILRVRSADHFLRHLLSGNGATRITSVLDHKENTRVR